MKNFIFVFIVIIALVFGYILGSIFPLNFFSSSQPQHQFSLPIIKDMGIQGNNRLEVILKMDNGRPLDNVEVDLAEVPGPPPIGGVALSDENGLAIFNVKPGNYFIFFNDNNFPKNVETPEPQPIEVKENNVNKAEIVLTIK